MIIDIGHWVILSTCLERLPELRSAIGGMLGLLSFVANVQYGLPQTL
jgi:hypothetical protein